MMSPFQDTSNCLLLIARSIQSHPLIHLSTPKSCGLFIHAQSILSPNPKQITYHHPQISNYLQTLTITEVKILILGKKTQQTNPLSTFQITLTWKPNSIFIRITLGTMNNYLPNTCLTMSFVTIGSNLLSSMRKIVKNPF